MELRHLRYLVGIVEAGSLTRAAAQLRVAQPALSRQLRDLEGEVGVALVLRRSHGIVPTLAGRALAEDAEEILARAAQAAVHAREVAEGESGQINLGYAPSPTVELLPQVLKEFARGLPRMRVILHDLSGYELLRGLHDGTLDFALMVDPGNVSARRVKFEPLRRYPQRLLVARDHPLSRRPRVRVEDVAREPLVIYRKSDYGEYFATVRRLLAKYTTRPRIAVECDGATSLMAAVASGRGVALVPSVFSELAGRQLRLCVLHPAPPPLVVGYARVVRPTGKAQVVRCEEILRTLAG